MAAHKRLATISLEETNFNNPSNEVDSEWERITEDPVKQVVFERKCIEDELMDKKQLILLQDNPSTRSHCHFWDCIPT